MENTRMRRSALLAAFLCLAVSVRANADWAEIKLKPISADGSHSIVGNEIVLTGSGPWRVFLELRVLGWDFFHTGIPAARLGAYEATINSTGYSSGTIGQLTSASEPCVDNAECVVAFGAGASCNDPPGKGVKCTAGFIDITHGQSFLPALRVEIFAAGN